MNPFRISTAPTIRRYAASACAALLLAACTNDDALSGADSEHLSNTPVTFNTRMQTALPQATPATRTVIGESGQTGWTQGDAVGIFMLSAGGTMPDDIILGADNIKYNAAPSGALSPAGTPVYYPQTAKVDFIALYPYSSKGEGNGKITADYKYTVSVADQTNPATTDVLYAKAPNRERSKTPVALSFSHVLSKIKLDIKPGNGMTGLTADQITAVTITGMPASATLALQDGTLTPGTTGDISALKEAKPSPGAIATFTALVPPQAANSYTRSIIVTVNGEEFTGNIPATDAYASNEMCTYPVTVLKRDIDVGEPEITSWTINDHDSGTAEFVYTVTFDANGGGNAPAPQEVPAGRLTYLPEGKGLTPPANKVFARWSTTADYSGVLYQAGDWFSPQSNTTLYAVWGGDGSSEENPIFIFDDEGLWTMRDKPDEHYCLMEDITVSDWNGPEAFSGTFNGQGHTVTINTIDGHSESSGLFRSGSTCRIRQVCVAGNIENSMDAMPGGGGIIGQAGAGCVIENCLVTANISLNNSFLGGIVGKGDDVIVKNCLVRGDIENLHSGVAAHVGGIIGSGSGQIANCVVLSQRLSNKAEATQASSIHRIGYGGGQNNYGYENMNGSYKDGSVIQGWTSEMSGPDGADCAPMPPLNWWTTANNWKIAWDCTAWDFTKIWEMGADGYPRLRIVHP